MTGILNLLLSPSFCDVCFSLTALPMSVLVLAPIGGALPARVGKKARRKKLAVHGKQQSRKREARLGFGCAVSSSLWRRRERQRVQNRDARFVSETFLYSELTHSLTQSLTHSLTHLLLHEIRLGPLIMATLARLSFPNAY